MPHLLALMSYAFNPALQVFGGWPVCNKGWRQPIPVLRLQVRYTCARDVKENVVMSVREFPTCNYVVVVSTPFLCKHPSFMPPVRLKCGHIGTGLF